MQALLFNAGELRFALRACDVVQVLPRRRLHPIAAAPDPVVGLLRFRGVLAPVVDICRLTLGRDTRSLRSSRIIVVAVTGGGQRREVGLLAENVMDLCPLGETTPGLRLPDRPWLGEHLAEHAELPQLLDIAALLPRELAALFVPEPPE